jgi:hypothetical protein
MLNVRAFYILIRVQEYLKAPLVPPGYRLQLSPVLGRLHNRIKIEINYSAEDMMPVSQTLSYPADTTIICNLAIIMPDEVAEENVKALLALGADVERVRPASIVDKKQVCPSFLN